MDNLLERFSITWLALNSAKLSSDIDFAVSSEPKSFDREPSEGRASQRGLNSDDNSDCCSDGENVELRLLGFEPIEVSSSLPLLSSISSEGGEIQDFMARFYAFLNPLPMVAIA